jgi:hypothetical protein
MVLLLQIQTPLLEVMAVQVVVVLLMFQELLPLVDQVLLDKVLLVLRQVIQHLDTVQALAVELVKQDNLEVELLEALVAMD